MAVVSGGTTLIDNGALDAGVPTGSLILLSTQTASASASIEFTSDIDSTYDSYVFKFIDIHPATDQALFSFNMSTDGGSNYNVAKTTTYFTAEHREDGTGGGLSYYTSLDLAQGTGYQNITRETANDNDIAGSGFLKIYNPSSSVFVKHFICTSNTIYNSTPDYAQNAFVAGYGNTTSAVNAISFKFSSGNIDSGTIKMYGVK